MLHIPVVQGHELYFGLPTFAMRSNKVQFSFFRDRVVKRIDRWQAMMFSRGGKEVLIKGILQAIPLYAMSYFRIPNSICEEIDKSLARFWWAGSA